MKHTLQTVLVIMLAFSCIMFMSSARPVHASTSTSSSFRILFQNFDYDNDEAEETIVGRTFEVFCNYDEDDYDSYENEDDDTVTYELDWYDDNNTDGTIISENCSSPVIATDGDTVFFTELRDDHDCLVKYTCSTDKEEVMKTTKKGNYIGLDAIRGNILFIDDSTKPMSVYGLDLQTNEYFKITGGTIEGFSGQYFLSAKCSVPCDDFFGTWYIYKMNGHKCIPVKKLTSCSNIARLQGGRIYYVSYSTSGKNQVMKIYTIKADGTGKKRIKTLKARQICAGDINQKHCWYSANNKSYRYDFSTRKVHKISNIVVGPVA
ncbi:MAG: hypothetical protein LKE86_00070 [Eubacterium sp.]|jgi:hypothetical protein|nr:hypothetical protein [Eubacterium sp.]MCH4045848.1 hypothetical protein [Eubacterium sp.]MCH4078939.1 hypothetical protein [Eubacterium sp.]